MTTDEPSFEVRVETPTADHYRHDWVPTPGVELAGMWGPAVVSSAEGRWFFGLRGWSDFVHGMTHTVSPVCGFQELKPGLDASPSHLFAEYSSIDWMEPYSLDEDGVRSTLRYDSGRVERELGGLRWADASGRWDLRGTTISDIFVVNVPVQPGVDQEVHYRHELLKAEGTVDGVEVEGYLHLDLAYGPPGTFYVDLAVARHLYGLWASWIHEDVDGRVGGGCFWQGRDGITFGPGYLLDDGTTTAYDDVACDIERNAAGQPTEIEVAIGDRRFRFDMEMAGSPIHYFGRAADLAGGPEITKSWVWIEHEGGLMGPEVLDAVSAKYRLAQGR